MLNHGNDNPQKISLSLYRACNMPVRAFGVGGNLEYLLTATGDMSLPGVASQFSPVNNYRAFKVAAGKAVVAVHTGCRCSVMGLLVRRWVGRRIV